MNMNTNMTNFIEKYSVELRSLYDDYMRQISNKFSDFR